ncbi:non-hydrolyzing UDP-N-acetylglucosamine 2-epimerase [Nigerium massiliense]|uniref:non-hydrolyzing UDP-N-acetylglucosamine 2-epimerase n=1 Tax=Nigerium massiliense TaxID=1522317 RepID=UPI0006935679|nr:UDP-N-acetylglucosamine 2-epimerase (non-hydrolyzing) [Nigerium massiliense]
MSEPRDAEQIALIVGTRPEAIKLAGLIRELGDAGRVIHTGQHYDKEMWHNVLADLAGVDVDAHISVGGRSRGEQIGVATTEITRYLTEHPARAVVVQGDTNSTLAGALAATSLNTPLVHVEAGLRSHDRRMPEEINRILTDAVADLCCAPLEANASQLASEGVAPGRVLVTGNTLADAMATLAATPQEAAATLAEHDVEKGRYVLATLHRAGTVDDEAALTRIVVALGALAGRTTVLLPLHPHTAKNVERWGLGERLGDVRVIAPLPPKAFIALEASAGLIVSDSGGVQEEACLFRRPLMVVRDSTERPELLDGWCRLLGDADPTAAFLQAWDDADAWAADLASRPLPYGDGSASAAIAAEINRRWPPATAS